MEFLELIKQFTDDVISDCRPVGNGHINDTFYIKGERNGYLLQRLNSGLFSEHTDVLEHNYLAYRAACNKLKDDIGEWELPHWLRCHAGSFLYKDNDSSIWRMYEYIKGDTLTAPLSKKYIMAFGAGLSKFHYILSEMDEKPLSILPGLHDAAAYYYEYRRCRGVTEKERRDGGPEDIIERKAESILKRKLPGMSVIHADAKAANGVFKDGKMIAMIDLDTIMQGPRVIDIADAVRSCCIYEDGFDNDSIKSFISGYQNAGYAVLSDEELDAVPSAIEQICYELGVRYYTDHMKGNVYFKQKQQGENLEKAIRLLHLSDGVVKLTGYRCL